MVSFFSKKSILDKVAQFKKKFTLEISRLKVTLSDKQFLRKLIATIIGTGICVIVSTWLTSKSSLGDNYYTYPGQLISVLTTIFLVPFVLNYAAENAKAHSTGWSYLIGAKVGSWVGLIISFIAGLCSILLKARWVLEEFRIALAAFFLILISGLVVGAIIGMLLLPIVRLSIYGSRIIRNDKNHIIAMLKKYYK